MTTDRDSAPTPGEARGMRPALEERIGALLDTARLDEAARAAIEGYGAEVLGYLTAVLRDETLASDAFSDFCERLWRGLPSFRRGSTVRTWAYTIAWSAAVDLTRDPHRRRGQPLGSGDASRLADRIRSATAPHLRTSMRDRVAALRASLAPDEQSLLVLRIDRGLSWREVAEVFGADEATLRKRFERIKDRLREDARKAGLLDE